MASAMRLSQAVVNCSVEILQAVAARVSVAHLAQLQQAAVARVATWGEVCRKSQAFQDILIATQFPTAGHVIDASVAEAAGFLDNRTTRKAPFGTFVHCGLNRYIRWSGCSSIPDYTGK